MLARVSTDAQDAQLQQDALTAAECGRVYVEKASTRKAAPSAQACLPRSATCAPLTRLSCGSWTGSAGRSVKEVLTIADDLHERGIGVRILTGKLSGTYCPTGEGKFFFTMMAAFAELERDIIHERTMVGLAAARARGRAGGRPTVMDADRLAAALARRERGESPAQIARALGVSRASVYRHLSAGDGSAVLLPAGRPGCPRRRDACLPAGAGCLGTQPLHAERAVRNARLHRGEPAHREKVPALPDARRTGRTADNQVPAESAHAGHTGGRRPGCRRYRSAG